MVHYEGAPDGGRASGESKHAGGRAAYRWKQDRYSWNAAQKFDSSSSCSKAQSFALLFGACCSLQHRPGSFCFRLRVIDCPAHSKTAISSFHKACIRNPSLCRNIFMLTSSCIQLHINDFVSLYAPSQLMNPVLLWKSPFPFHLRWPEYAEKRDRHTCVEFEAMAHALFR